MDRYLIKILKKDKWCLPYLNVVVFSVIALGIFTYNTDFGLGLGIFAFFSFLVGMFHYTSDNLSPHLVSLFKNLDIEIHLYMFVLQILLLVGLLVFLFPKRVKNNI